MKFTTTLRRVICTAGMVVVFAVLSMQVVYAETGYEAGVSDVLNRIAATQDVSDVRDIVCENVSDNDLEMLGDALMGKMLDEEAVHENMDEMMGGEGSKTLYTMHENMGRMYLDCNDSGFGSGFMMGDGMMLGMMEGNVANSQGFGANKLPATANDNMFGSMMGSNAMLADLSLFGDVFMFLFWILVIIGVVFLIQKLNRHDEKQYSNREVDNGAFNILKERYARGEIEKKEFEEMKKDLEV